MYLVVNDFYTDNQAVIDAVPARATAFAQLGTNITTINTLVAGQSTNTTGVAQDKSGLRNTLDNITVTTLATARAWALSADNNTLAEEFNYSLSEIQKIKDDTMQGFCDHRIALVNDNLAAMADFGIDAAAVTVWQNALDAYVAVLETPREAINARHLNTVGLKDTFSETSLLFKEQLDPLMMVFKLYNPDLYAAYKQARMIIDRKGSGTDPKPIPTGTIQLTGTVTDFTTALPIEDATVSIIGPSSPDPFTTLTNTNGRYTINVPGYEPDSTNNIDVTYSATGYEDNTETISAIAGQSTEHNTQLKASA